MYHVSYLGLPVFWVICIKVSGEFKTFDEYAKKKLNAKVLELIYLLGIVSNSQ